MSKRHRNFGLSRQEPKVRSEPHMNVRFGPQSGRSRANFQTRRRSGIDPKRTFACS